VYIRCAWCQNSKPNFEKGGTCWAISNGCRAAEFLSEFVKDMSFFEKLDDETEPEAITQFARDVDCIWPTNPRLKELGFTRRISSERRPHNIQVRLSVSLIDSNSLQKQGRIMLTSLSRRSCWKLETYEQIRRKLKVQLTLNSSGTNRDRMAFRSSKSGTGVLEISFLHFCI